MGLNFEENGDKKIIFNFQSKFKNYQLYWLERLSSTNYLDQYLLLIQFIKKVNHKVAKTFSG